MKKLLLTVLAALISTFVYSQSNFYKLGIGAGFGPTYAFGDPEKGGLSFAANLATDLYFTPFITAGLEVQIGTAKGGDVVTDPHMREFSNSYKSFVLNGKVRLGQFTDYYYSNFLDYTKGFYVGTGVGVIQNNLKSVVRVKPDGSDYVFPGEDKSSNLIIPVNIGIDFHFFDQWGDVRYVLNLNLQNSVIIGEGLDGYNDPPAIFKNNRPDLLTYFSVGFRYNFGFTGLTNKTMR